VKRLFHKQEADQPLVEIDTALLDAAIDRGGLVWLDVEDEDDDEARRIGRQLGLDAKSVEKTIDGMTMPMFDEHPSHLFVVLAGPTTGQAGRLGTVELDLFVGTNLLVTMHETSLPSIEYLMSDLAITVETATPTELTALISQIGGRRFLPLIEELESRIDDLEEAALRADPQTLPDVHALRRDVVLLQRLVGRQRIVFGELAVSTHPVLDAQSRRDFETFHEQFQRLTENLEGARALLNSVVETYRGAVADQTNEIVRILTVFSAIMLPLSLIAGMWGMNFGNIPGGAERWGFYTMVGVMALVGVTFWIYFARRGFVGAPRLRDLPKSVGLGIVQVGVTPVKLVSTGIETTVRGIGRLVTGSSPTEDDSDQS
jgi:magnesium transporter